MNSKGQVEKANRFLEMHIAPEILVLPNAWDVSSAKIYEYAGFKAIATTSAGIAATLGFPDGERMSLRENLEVAQRIVDNTDLPVSIDAEAGYSETLEGIVLTAQAILEVGAVGLNIEDGTGDPQFPLLDACQMCDRITAIREQANLKGIPLVINARTDVYLLDGKEENARFSETVHRAGAYSEAGADCIFVPSMPGIFDEVLISRLVRDIDVPVNIIADSTSPPLSQLEELGVSRVSLGPRPMRATMALLKAISEEIIQSGTFSSMDDRAISYSQVNNMFNS